MDSDIADRAMEKKIESVCRAAIRAFGEKHQTRKAIEEMGELNAALMQYRDGRATKEAVVTEIADVLITGSPLGIIFGTDDVSREVERKIERLADTTAKRIIENCEKEHNAIILNRNLVIERLAKELNGLRPNTEVLQDNALKREYYGG